MSSDISYTTEEIAKLLKISKLTVYDLIKKGELPSYRVGKQMRVDAADLEAYKQRAKGLQAAEHRPAPAEPVSFQPAAVGAGGTRSVVITGQDISLDILVKHMEKQTPGIRPLRAYVGSLDSLIAMYRGESDIVSTHLLDGDTGEYNLPYIKRILVGFPYLVVNLLSRKAGLYVQKGNPLGLKDWADLSRPGLQLVNREKGSGARVLLDEQLRLHGIRRDQLQGYGEEQTNHIAVAGTVAAGEADVGVGIEKAAAIVGGVDFIPLIEERYDLVVLKSAENMPWIESLMGILRSEEFRRELQSIAGYDLSRTGEILLET
ncbi:helix-turn-helix transcriptional regulator [Paenibacillus cellulositrophicus]|uniref:helix-turn-helix transcriptional regulator n=1 Tax=Paenibacillus cellulositrophicus TaxID=562959 RepID=UPI00203AF599|nr:helix-turn-helix transcriptional regulator [Paenibacillus cellulositrophicus]MCM2996641.1 helix-turn-helix transcriptional regulator [Paenibacillus cellulositrophicus]